MPVDLTNTYPGRIYYSDKGGDNYFMKGFVTLVISGREITLKQGGRDGKELKGSIKTELLPDQGSLRVGEVKFGDDEAIEIRWDRAGNKIRLVRAANEANAKRVFRFCSSGVSIAQCKGDFNAPPARRTRAR